MSSSLLLQQCPACLVRLTWIVFVMGGRWPYSWCLVEYYRQDLFNIAQFNTFLHSIFLIALLNLYPVPLYENYIQLQFNITTKGLKMNSLFENIDGFNLGSISCPLIGSLSIAFNTFVSRVSMSFSVDETIYNNVIESMLSFNTF